MSSASSAAPTAELLPPAPPLLRIETSRDGGVNSQTVRNKALAHVAAGELTAALPLFEAIAALHPNEPQYNSDLGVTWMRLNEWPQAWAAFARALSMNPSHSLALENADALRQFLGDEHPVVVANELTPERRMPHLREHSVQGLPGSWPRSFHSLPPEGHEFQWWRTPLMLAPPGTGAHADTSVRPRASLPASDGSGADADFTRFERVLAERLGYKDARYYPGGRVHMASLAYTHPVLSTLRAIRTPAARAGRALAIIPLDGSTDEFNLTLAELKIKMPAVMLNMTQHPTAVVPTGSCLKSLRGAGQLYNYDRLIHRRSLVFSAAPHAGKFLSRDRLGTATWQLQIRGAKKCALLATPSRRVTAHLIASPRISSHLTTSHRLSQVAALPRQRQCARRAVRATQD
jgi:hypothetical protein